MIKFTSRQDLEAYAGNLRGGEPAPTKILIGMSTCGRASGAEEVYRALIDAAQQHGLDNVSIVKTGCVGLCHAEPLVEVEEPGHPRVTIGDVDPGRAREIIEAVATNAKIPHPYTLGMGIYAKQERIALRNCGRIDPEQIDEYIRTGGYRQLASAIFDKPPEDIIETVKASGLRGRGGGGFPTGIKWAAARKAEGSPKYIVCNADEGDPGAFMDRSILEGDPYSVIEAMAIAGYAVGANKGFIYVRAEYPLAIHHLRVAVERARQHGLLGANILGSDFSFDLKMKFGAGAFVCGEETALLRSIEGSRGQPTVKPPFPAQAGLWGKPTVVNNVETFANIVPILEKGSDWFRSIGTENSPGTKVFALAGNVKNVGLVEVPMGTTLNEIIHDLGGGSRSGKPVKAVQTGGPSGGCIPSEKFDTPIDYDNLIELGSMMGSGGMIVMDEDTSMIGIARFYLQFTCDESCGKCTLCRLGTKRLLQLLDKLLAGAGGPEDIDELQTLGQCVKDGSLCGLGKTAPNPILSTLRWYRKEYDDLAYGGKMIYRIVAEKCIGCTACAKACPAECIEGEKKEPHTIRQEDCIQCGTCIEKCNTGAIIRAAAECAGAR
ncbi:MAG: NADH-quinone oxidoreductase subunit NuoF [Planctomycetes bacterium]|nr:NADH-quinone oxidoreductase subunit NuoF [Planctomycetota bacterium]